MAPVVDNFDRRNATIRNASALGANWTGTGGTAGGFKLTASPPGINLPVANDVTAQFPGVPFLGGPSTLTIWRGPNSLLGANQEAGFTVLSTDNLPANGATDDNVVWESLVLKQTGVGASTSYIEVRYSERLQRIEEASDRDELIAELRELVREVEAWVRAEAAMIPA